MHKLTPVALSASRLVVAAYMGALIAGPAPYGMVLLLPKALWHGLGLPMVLIDLFLIPWIAVGLIGGRRLGPISAPLGFLLMEWHFIAETFVKDIPWHGRPFAVVMLIAVMLIPAAVAALAASVTQRWRLSRALDNWRYWPAPAVVLLLTLTYTLTLGPSVALDAMHDKFAAVWPADTSRVKAYTAGAYLAVDGITGCEGCGFPDTYYTDPTGLVFLFKCNLD
jgi:hypothetical protein